MTPDHWTMIDRYYEIDFSDFGQKLTCTLCGQVFRSDRFDQTHLVLLDPWNHLVGAHKVAAPVRAFGEG